MQAMGTDVDFAFHTIGWKAFQDLALAVCSYAYEQPISIFAATHDGGRDGGFRALLATPGKLQTGAVQIQCKHSATDGRSLTLASLKGELQKAERLAADGLAANYILITNMRLTGAEEEKIASAFRRIQGLAHFVVHGKEWLTQEIQKSAALRRFVPRVYGLGDLGKILEERSSQQSRQILASLKRELRTFVVTGAYVRSLRALDRHGIVLLLGDPGSGKSTIAGTLSVAALDEKKIPTFKIDDADAFSALWDPNEMAQVFWIDDAFGATQFQRRDAERWSAKLKAVQVAIDAGARFIFTSRTYIYREAESYIKSGLLPQLITSQIVVEVEELTPGEKQQMLYNHLKFGTQPKLFRSVIKSHLRAAANTRYFLPEVARRLSDPFFTAGISLTREGVADFFARPLEYLIETISRLETRQRNALFLLFMHGGRLPSPLQYDTFHPGSLELLSLTLEDVRASFKALDGTLTMFQEGEGWSFKHPSIRDSISRIVGSNADLIDVYLQGTPMKRALVEVSCIGRRVTGSNVVLSPPRYAVFARRLSAQPLDDVASFLVYRADEHFCSTMETECPDAYMDILRNGCELPTTILGYAFARLNEVKRVDEMLRKRFVKQAIRVSVERPTEILFSNPSVMNVFDDEEVAELERTFLEDVVRHFDNVEEKWYDNYEVGGEPEEYVEELRDVLRAFRDKFALLRPEVRNEIDMCLGYCDGLEDRISQFEAEQDDVSGDPYDVDYDPDLHFSSRDSERDIFDDVDD